MKFYGFRHEDLVEMPIKRFWAYSNTIDRIQAADDMRQLHMLAGVTSQEGFDRLQANLTQEVGQVYVFQPVAQTFDVSDLTAPDPELDRTGLESLRANIMRHGR